VTARVERVLTSGVFTLDGQSFDVDNNVWLYGDDASVVIIDAAHDAAAIAAAVGGRSVELIVCTHGHNDHIDAARALARVTGATVALHPDDRMLWDQLYPDWAPGRDLVDGEPLPLGLIVLHTPGHSPGGVCLRADGLVFTGDTLFAGGPGATGRSYSDFPTILDSIRTRLLTLPPDTRVLTGHGDVTSIDAEAPGYDAWVARGH